MQKRFNDATIANIIIANSSFRKVPGGRSMFSHSKSIFGERQQIDTWHLKLLCCCCCIYKFFSSKHLQQHFSSSFKQAAHHFCNCAQHKRNFHLFSVILPHRRLEKNWRLFGKPNERFPHTNTHARTRTHAHTKKITIRCFRSTPAARASNNPFFSSLSLSFSGSLYYLFYFFPFSFFFFCQSVQTVCLLVILWYLFLADN